MACLQLAGVVSLGPMPPIEPKPDNSPLAEGLSLKDIFFFCSPALSRTRPGGPRCSGNAQGIQNYRQHLRFPLDSVSQPRIPQGLRHSLDLVPRRQAKARLGANVGGREDNVPRYSGWSELYQAAPLNRRCSAPRPRYSTCASAGVLPRGAESLSSSSDRLHRDTHPPLSKGVFCPRSARAGP